MSKTILIAEDNEFFITMLKNQFENEGFSVFTVDNGRSAIEQAIKLRPDYVFLDIIMPEVDGFDVLTAIRKNKSLSKSKVIMFSSLGQEEDKKKATDLGADDYIIKKSLSINDLITRIKNGL